MEHFPILSILILIPVIGAIFIAFFVQGNTEQSNDRSFSMGIWASSITLILSLFLIISFDQSNPDFQFTENYRWIPDYGINFNLGVDGISLFMIALTTILSPIALCASRNAIAKRGKEFVLYFLVLESCVLGTFLALDLVVFYIFFELMLVPMFLLIGIWGGANRTYAAYKFFLYTLAGSILFLIAIIYIYNVTESTDIIYLKHNLSYLLTVEEQKYLWLAFFVAFAVKIPMWPFHTWLPDAHVEAPTAGSVMLAGILIKMGAYGFLRFSLPFFPTASIYFQDFVLVLSLIAIVYTSIVALMQEDMKKMIAYSSVAHMGYVTLGIFSFTSSGISGALFQMISHGIISGALFLLVGVIYERLKTKKIKDIKGVANVMPKYAIFFMLFVFGSVALPGTSGFVGEFLTILAVYKVSASYAFFAGLGVILGATYMLYLAKQVIFGEVQNDKVAVLKDIGKLEVIMFVPLAIFVVVLGIYPALIFDYTNTTIDALVNSSFALNF